MTAVGDFGLSHIGQIAINVHDLKRATVFYRDMLGMKFLFEVPNLAFFDCGGVRLWASPRSPSSITQPRSSTTASMTSTSPMLPSLPAAWRSKAGRTWSPACRITICGWLSSATPRATCSRS